MFIITRAWVRSSLILPLAPKTRLPYFFCSEPTYTKLKQMHSSLLKEHRKLKPQRTIKMLYYINAKCQTRPQQNLLSPAQIHQITQSLISELPNLTHQDLTLLLQTISDFPNFSRYSRNNDFMKLMMKKLNTIQVMTLDPKYMFRLLNVLEKMAFPAMIVVKFINSVLARDGKVGMNNLDTLRFFICILEMKRVHVSYVQRMYEKEIKGIQLTTPKQFVYMYLFTQTLQKSLQSKITYLSNKLKTHSLVFQYPSDNQNQTQTQNDNNNNSNNNSNKDKDKDNKSQQSEAGQNSAQAQRQKMIQASQQLIMDVRKQIDVQKLKSTICRFYQFEKFPLDASTAMILHRMEELKPTLYQYFKTNYRKMHPREFICMLPSCPEPERLTYYNTYTGQTWKHQPTLYKLSLLTCKAEVCNCPLTKQNILQIIQELKSITREQLQFVYFMLNRYLKDQDREEVLRVVEGVGGIIEDN